MNNFRSLTINFIVVLTLSCGVHAQTDKSRQVTKAFAALVTTIDTKTTNRQDEVILRTINDVVVDGKVLIPRNAKIIGHVAGISGRTNDKPKAAVAITIDRAITSGGDIQLKAIIVALAAPKAPVTTSTTADATSSPYETLLLTETSQGAYGYGDLEISWHLTIPPPLTIFATKAKRLKLDSGTQVLLRMLPPKLQN